MKNKKITIGLIAVILIFCSAISFAAMFIMTSEEESVNPQTIPDAAQINVGVSASDIKTETEVLSSKNIQSFVSGFDIQNLTYEQYLSLEAYLNFVLKHTLSEEELSHINALVKNGTTVETITDIYDFYLTTNEDFEIISQIAALEDEIWGKNWIENAFNKITQNKYGVITAAEASEYMEAFDTDEILYANILSRKGVYTIQEILSMHKDGTSWSEITDEVYSSVIIDQKLTGSKAERNNIFIYLNDKNFIYDDSPYEIYELASRCARHKVTLGDALVGAENVGELKKKVTEEIDNKYIPAVNKLKEIAGLPDEYMTREEYSVYYNEYLSEALNSGMNEKEIEQLERKGYSMKEIADYGKGYEGDISTAVKSVKARRGAEIK